MNIHNSSTNRPPIWKGVSNNLPPITVPGQALSIQEVIARYQSGRDVSHFAGSYTDSDLVPDNWERMDVMERLDYTRQMRVDIALAARRMDDAAKAAEAAKDVPKKDVKDVLTADENGAKSAPPKGA